MTLLIDIGNTRLKIGSTHNEATYAVSHQHIEQILPWLEQQSFITPPKKALGLCVASPEIAQHTEQLLSRIDCPIDWVDGTLTCHLLDNHYENPLRLGADRWLSLIGILSQYPQYKHRPIIHASFGTATTVDTILPSTQPNGASQFVGGLILPGPQLMYDSLALNTSQLGNGLGKTQPHPTNTRAAISSGINAAQMGAVLKQWHLSRQKHQHTPLLICSGGGWFLLQTEAQKIYAELLQQLGLKDEAIIWRPTPVLDGLNYIATHI